MDQEKAVEEGTVIDVCDTLRLVQDGLAHGKSGGIPELLESSTSVLSALVLVLCQRQAVVSSYIANEIRAIRRMLRRVQ